jgi:hypothetical protein
MSLHIAFALFDGSERCLAPEGGRRRDGRVPDAHLERPTVPASIPFPNKATLQQTLDTEYARRHRCVGGLP